MVQWVVVVASAVGVVGVADIVVELHLVVGYGNYIAAVVTDVNRIAVDLVSSVASFFL